MAIETTLDSIDTTLKAILVALSSGTAAVAQLGTPEGKNEGATETQYAVSKDGSALYVIEPGKKVPKGASLISEQLYRDAVAEQEKKSSAAASQPSGAATEPSATAGQDTASVPTFQDVVAELTKLSKTAEPKGGRKAVLDLLTKFLPDLPEAERKVPKLEALGKNAEIIAAVESALSDKIEEVDLF